MDSPHYIRWLEKKNKNYLMGKLQSQIFFNEIFKVYNSKLMFTIIYQKNGFTSLQKVAREQK